MKLFFKTSLILATLVLLSGSSTAKDPVKKASSTLRTYHAAQQLGTIGVSEDSPIDNPVDNLFHINLEVSVCETDKVWLVYELNGVQDHTSVSRSINDQLAVGGYLVKRRRGWAVQREQIDASWLKQGDNVVRFTAPEQVQHAYSVRNVHLEVESNSKDAGTTVVLNQPLGKPYYFQRAYLKGFVKRKNSQAVQVLIAGKPARLHGSEFESSLEFDGQHGCETDIEVIYADGTRECAVVSFEDALSTDFQFDLSLRAYHNERHVEVNKPVALELQGAGISAEGPEINSSAILSITTLRDVDMPALDAGMVNVTGKHYGFRFLPHGTQFESEVNIKLPYDADKIPDGYTEQDIRTYYFDELTHHWVALKLDTVLGDRSVVLSRSTHFTDMINGILKVPESPEAEAYNSTSIKGIKAANPSSAVNLINAPQASNMGSASVSYPITLPGGRAGMQPQVSVGYNSGAGNGWMGLGWNVSVPMISIETRWGVPRYDAAKETETYVMNGEMLTPVAHRAEAVARSSGDKRFYPRIEGSFNKIVRHGTGPSNYWWEVTDKNGVKLFYGGTSTGLDKQAVLRDNEQGDAGNIAQWCLSEMRDPNGNTVRYHYVKVEDKGVANGTVNGYQIYVDRITYTGFRSSEGKFAVVFKRDRQLGEVKRKDITISGNLGFKMVTADLLRKIEVQFEGKNIRHYEFKYQTGEFYKNLLASINEFDAQGNLFNKHELEYFNDVRSGTTLTPFKASKSWTMPSDGIDGGLLVSKVGFDDNASALSGNKGSDFGFGMTVTVGFNDGQLVNKSNTLGGSFGYSESETNGKLYTIDINGDGLTDKVMLDDNGFRYRANLSNNETPRYSQNTIEIRNRGKFYSEKSKTVNAGFEAQGGFGNITAFVGAGTSKTTSVTSVYFADVNGDQLPDLIENGVAYFNHLDRSTGIVTFLPSSAQTPSPIATGGSVAAGIFEVDPQELEQDIDANPLHDVVRMWRAPFAGTISIHAPVKLLATPTTSPNADGVKVSMQKNGNVLLWDKIIGPTDFSEYMPVGVNQLTVAKGDRIYFRVQSVFNGENDLVQWAPTITYLDEDLLLTDANDRKIYQYNAKNEYVLSAPLEVATPIKGTIAIKSILKKPQTTDDIKVEIVRKNASGTTIPFSKVYTWDQTIDEPIDLSLAVNANESFYFRVTSATNVDWPAIFWKPHLYYTASGDPNVTELFRDGKPLISFYAVPDFSLFANALNITTPYVVTEEIDSLDAEALVAFPVITLPDINRFNGQLMFSVKKRDTLLLKEPLTIQLGQITSESVFRIGAKQGDTLYFEYHAADEKLAESMTGFEVNVLEGDVDSTFNAGLYTRYTNKEDFIFGTLYRQWGYFAYNGNRGRANALINEADLKLSEKLEREYNSGDVDSQEDLSNSGAYDPSKDNFVMLFAKGKERSWSGYDEYTFVDSARVSSSRLGNDDLSPVAAVPGGGGGVSIRAINKISKSTNNSLSGGVSGSVANGSANFSTGSSKVMTDFLDLNGDRYPDIVTDKGVQFTKPIGILQEGFEPFTSGDVTKSTTSSFGASAGGFVKPKSKGGTTNIKQMLSDVGGAKVSGVISVNYGEGKNEGDFSWQDINGDGLPDRVNSNGSVQLNLGYKLAPAEPWGFGGIQKSESKSAGGGLGVSIGVGSESSSISAGVGLSRSDNDVARVLQDLNGDGLLDEVNLSSGVKVKLNTGNGFSSSMLTDWSGASKINESSTTGESANAAFTGCIPLPPIAPVVKLCFNPSGNVGHSMSRDKAQISDFDGDGFPDYVTSENDGDLHVSSSAIGRTNLLKKVKRPMGATLTLNYQRLGNTYDMPNNVWALASVKTFDGFAGDGVDTLMTSFVYEGGFYNRHERDFFGFRKVQTRTHDTGKENYPVYTITEQTFLNTNYYEKGLMVNELVTDGDGNKFVEKGNTFELKNILTGSPVPESARTDAAGAAFPALTATFQRFYEGETTPGKSLSMTYEYDALGNVIRYSDLGGEGPDDDLLALISYHSLEDLYIVASPKSITITGSGVTYRKRESVIDPVTGDVTVIKQWLNESDAAIFNLEYDDYGNLSKLTRPANHKNERMSLMYEFDSQVQTYTSKITNSYGYSSERKYDVRYGQPLEIKDVNANPITYELDAVGRIKSIRGPYEKAGNDRTITFEYHPEGLVPWALTSHFDPQNPTNKIQTSVFADGMGKMLQTKKDAALFEGEGKADKEVMVVSGRVIFDAFGRTVKAYYPIVEDLNKQGEFNKKFDTVKPVESTYDVMNRVLSVTLPDGSKTVTDYGFANDRYGVQQFSTKTTDANGKQAEQFTDVRGRVTSSKNYTSQDAVWTSFKYNAINEQIEATDDLGHTVFSVYDNFGRRTSRVHPDAGTTTYAYDMAGNLRELVTANLGKEGQSIRYNYEYERLVEIIYPENTENNVKYTYGQPGASDNRAGKVILQEDGTGAQEFFYGPLGEIVKNVRTIVLPKFGEQTYVTEWKYDTWNRLSGMTYADGEEVTYAYNAGGLLRSMTGKKKNATYTYVSQLGYDKFEQRVLLAYGNGTKTTYSYEEDRRRLKNITAQTAAKRTFINNAFAYDKVNNVISLVNSAPIPAANLMGGASEYTYEYDDLYRLSAASGVYKSKNDEHHYSLSLAYNTVGGILQKTQVHDRKGVLQKKTSYQYNYQYGEDQPHAPIHIGGTLAAESGKGEAKTYTYDLNGNQTGWTDDLSGQERKVMWDEENRIRSIYDNGSQHHYGYDASGERVWKVKSTGQRVFVNGEWKAGSGQMGNFTVYVNPYLVLRSGGYTKHFYIENQRIASKLGGGWDNNGKGPLKAGGDKVDYAGKGQRIFDGIVKNLKFLGADGQILTAGNSGKVPPGQINGSGNVSEAFRYFYHSDYLGSTSYVTDASGEVFQHLEYFAFGETFVEEHSNTDRTPYLFNGKELDEETGLYYYSARYYDPQVSIWQSLDPKGDDMPGISPFAFSGNNPVNLVDPDGKLPIMPLVWWVGKRAAAGAIADIAVQYITEWVTGGGDMADAWGRLDIDWGQVARSAGENLVKDKYSAAALSAAGDMITYLMEHEDATIEGALLAAGEGAISSLLGDKLAGAFLKKLKLDAGGAYGKFKNEYDELGNLLTNKNHLPTLNSFKLAGFKISEYMGAAHIMEVQDHLDFISTGSKGAAKAFRQAEAKLLKEGKFLEAFDLNVNAIREQFGSKYDKALEKARKYYQETVIPELQKQQ